MGRAVRPRTPLQVHLNIAGPVLQLLREVVELVATLPGRQHGNASAGAAGVPDPGTHNSGPPVLVRLGPDIRQGLPGGLHIAQERRNRLPQDRCLPRAQRPRIKAQRARPLPALVRRVTHALTLKAVVGSAPDAPIFTSPAGNLLHHGNFRKRVWLPALSKAGLSGVRLHDLRHAGNVLVADAGGNLRELMERMGHSTTRAALIYLHGGDDRQR